MTKEQEAEWIRSVINDTLDERSNREENRRVSSDLHADQHAWIAAQIEQQRARRELMMTIAKAVAQWSVVGILGTIWYYAQAFVKAHWS